MRTLPAMLATSIVVACGTTGTVPLVTPAPAPPAEVATPIPSVTAAAVPSASERSATVVPTAATVVAPSLTAVAPTLPAATPPSATPIRTPVLPTATPVPSTPVPTPTASPRPAFLTLPLVDVRTGERFTLGGEVGKVTLVLAMAVW